jgi:hypothetical protein
LDPESDWIDLDRYLVLHAACLRDFDHFIERSTINVRMKGSGDILVKGRLHCVGGTYVNVTDQLQRIDLAHVRTLGYSFHAGLRGEPDRAIFRYDNAHTYLREGQPDAHHKHRYDVVTGREIKPPEWVGRDRVPTLCAVLTELEQWWLETGQFL